jgi:hypothetical protein
MYVDVRDIASVVLSMFAGVPINVDSCYGVKENILMSVLMIFVAVGPDD